MPELILPPSDVPTYWIQYNLNPQTRRNIGIDDEMLLRSEDGKKLYPKLKTAVWLKIGTGWFLLPGGNGPR